MSDEMCTTDHLPTKLEQINGRHEAERKVLTEKIMREFKLDDICTALDPAIADRQPCDNSCVINSRIGGDHVYCECHCHTGTLPAIPPSRERRKMQQ